MTGTSQATAFVTGAAALIMSHKNQYFDATEVKNYILATGDSSPSLLAKTKTSRQLNLFKALTILGNETGLTGIAKQRVQDSFPSDSNKRESGSANSKDPNLKSVNNVAQFGRLLLNNLPNEGRKKKQNTRIGSELKPTENEN